MWSGSEDNTIRVWSVLDMSMKKSMQGHKGPVCSMVEMGIHVWSGSSDANILVWDAATYRLLFSLGDQGGYATRYSSTTILKKSINLIVYKTLQV